MSHDIEEKKLRPDCPFYGLHYANNAFSEGIFPNQCGLDKKNVSTCVMENKKEKVCWEEYPLNTLEARKWIKESLDRVTVFPNLEQIADPPEETLDPDSDPANGIPLKEWYERRKEFPGIII